MKYLNLLILAIFSENYIDTPWYWCIVMIGMCNSANNIGEVRMPMTPKDIPIIPAAYSFWRHANNPKIRASGLNRGDNINTPMNPNMILKVP